MAGTGRLQADPLFQGLTRPSMIFGVTYLYFVLNMMICMITFVNTSNFVMLLFVFPAVHGIGYLICMKEPRALELLLLRAGKGMRCLNRRFHGYTNSYDIY